ncbi:MAG TPA: hypothetical protein QKA14_00305 [Candidatus Megaira endosymbiont of Hartmannula sinica]|nr:hypothetical protein [Candidatus Megaera endosymbiont of Hartmannula sinica]
MSKSIGNVVITSNLQKNNLPSEVLRLFFISKTYRKPIDYNSQSLMNCFKTISSWYNIINNYNILLKNLNKNNITNEIKDVLDIDLFKDIYEINNTNVKNIKNIHLLPINSMFMEALLDDMNFSKAIAILNQNFKEADKLIKSSDLSNIKQISNIFNILKSSIASAIFLGVMNRKLDDWQNNIEKNRKIIESLGNKKTSQTYNKQVTTLNEEIDFLIQKRLMHKKNKDWYKADKIRDDLLKKKIMITDNKDGSTSFKHI